MLKFVFNCLKSFVKASLFPFLKEDTDILRAIRENGKAQIQGVGQRR